MFGPVGRPRRRTPPNHSFDAFGSSKDTAVTEQTLLLHPDRISNRCSPCRRSIEIPAERHAAGKKADEGHGCKRFQKPVAWYSFISAGGGLSSHFSTVNLVFRWP